MSTKVAEEFPTTGITMNLSGFIDNNSTDKAYRAARAGLQDLFDEGAYTMIPVSRSRGWAVFGVVAHGKELVFQCSCLDIKVIANQSAAEAVDDFLSADVQPTVSSVSIGGGYRIIGVGIDASRQRSDVKREMEPVVRWVSQLQSACAEKAKASRMPGKARSCIPKGMCMFLPLVLVPPSTGGKVHEDMISHVSLCIDRNVGPFLTQSVISAEVSIGHWKLV